MLQRVVILVHIRSGTDLILLLIFFMLLFLLGRPCLKMPKGATSCKIRLVNCDIAGCCVDRLVTVRPAAYW